MPTKSALLTNALLLALLPLAPIPAAHAQTATESLKSESAHSDPASWPVHTYFLRTDDQAAIGEVTNALRNVLPRGTDVVGVYSEKAVVIRTNPAYISTVEEIVNELDRPRKTYRVTYTLAEMDNNKRLGTQHFAVVMVSGQKTKFRQGSKVPIATGSFGAKDQEPVQTQFTYMDVDLTVEATLSEIGTDGDLRYDLDQNSVAAETSTTAPHNPIVRHTSLTGQATLTPNKPLMLGSIDFPGSTRRLDVEALMEPLP